MQDQKDPRPDSDDELRAENNLLKVKLELEHDMLHMEGSGTLPPDVENEWLKSVYAFEQQFRNCKQVKVYDYIGRPPYKKWDTLSPVEVTEELVRLQAVMEQNAVRLDCICEYSDAVIYRFITEELFEHEMDDMRIPGMTCNYIYEEFHPNHSYDLRRLAGDFVDAAFTREWIGKIDDRHLAENISFGGKMFDRNGISSIIRSFQEMHVMLDVEVFDIGDVVIDPDTSKAVVHGSIWIAGQSKGGDKVAYQGPCSFHFIMEDGYWDIAAFDVPGFSAPV